jgi:hypothetical protein
MHFHPALFSPISPFYFIFNFISFCFEAGAAFVPASINIPEASCLLPHQVDPKLYEVHILQQKQQSNYITRNLKRNAAEKHVSF